MAKAFDTVDHPLLLSKLATYGISGLSLEWFASYLSGCTQRTVINGSSSQPLPIFAGVPQGSVLGPNLFSIHINSLHHVHTTVLFADDTTLYISGSSVSHINSILYSALSKCNAWVSANKLSLTVQKTNVRSSILHVGISPLSFSLNGSTIKQVSTYTYLG